MAEQILEIKRLMEMLQEAEIPFTWEQHDFRPYYDEWKYHIYYPQLEVSTYGLQYVCSVIQGKFTYGSEANLLEISGLLTPKERAFDDVIGWLTAEEVFERIKKHYEGSKQ